jgi:hypothetical protein
MFLRKPTRDNITIGMCYSIFQKCIRRGLVEEALHYGRLIKLDGTPNALRKRMVLVCLEDMGHWSLALELKGLKDSQLLDYIQIMCANKKTHLTAYLSRICLYEIENSIESNDNLINEVKTYIRYFVEEKWKELRQFLGKRGVGCLHLVVKVY